MTFPHTRIFHCDNMKNESNSSHKKTKWVNSVWMQDLYMLLRLDSISWRKTLKNSYLRKLVMNTLFQEMTDHHNQKDGFRETRELDPRWKLRPIVCMENMELKSESGLWVETTLNPGSEFLIDQINSWLIQTSTTQKFLQIYLKNKRHNWLWRILQPDQRQKQNHKEENLLIYRASFRWMKESGLILNQEILLSLCVRDFPNSTTRRRRSSSILEDQELSSKSISTSTHWSDDRWILCLAAGGGPKRRYQCCTDISGTIVYLRALQGHSGRNLIDPSLQDNVIIQSRFFQYIYHILCGINLHSIINNGLIHGRQSSSKRQTVFFLPIDPRDKGHRDPVEIDLNQPRRAQYLHSAWKKHQDAVFWVDINPAIRKGLTFYQTRSNAIILQGSLPAYCIPKVVRLKTGEVLYEKSYMSLRPPPKISLRHDQDWTWGKVQLGSTVEQQPHSKVVLQSRGVGQHVAFSQLTQPIPKPISDRSGQPDDSHSVSVAKRETSRSLEIEGKGFHERLFESERSGQPDGVSDI